MKNNIALEMVSESLLEDMEKFEDKKYMLTALSRMFNSFYKFGGICSYNGWTIHRGGCDLEWELMYKGNHIVSCVADTLETAFQLPEGMTKGVQTKICSFLLGSAMSFTLCNEKKREIRERAYDCLCLENADMSRIEKVLTVYFNGRLNKENYYDTIRGFTKRVTSDHSIKRWQIIAEWFYGYLFF